MAAAMAAVLAALLISSSAVSAAPNQSASEVDDKRVQDLLALQRKSKGGLITLSTVSFDRFVSGKSRPYSLFVMADARQFRRQGKLKLEDVVKSFGAVSRAFGAAHAGQPTQGKAFFVRVIFEDAREVFGRLGIKNLPYLVHIPPSLAIKPGSAVQLPKNEELKSGGGPWSANDIASFVADRSGLNPGDITEATAAPRNRFLPLITLAVVGAACAIGWQLYQAPFVRWAPLYAAGGLAIYWFAVSGGMYNIIRGVPFVGYDRRTGAASLFMEGSGQLGAEGFIMGSFYLFVGLAVAALTRVLPTIKDEGSRRAGGYVLLVLVALAMRQVLSGHAWKTGMRSHYYF